MFECCYYYGVTKEGKGFIADNATMATQPFPPSQQFRWMDATTLPGLRGFQTALHAIELHRDGPPDVIRLMLTKYTDRRISHEVCQ